MILFFCLKRIPLGIFFLVLLLVGGYLYSGSVGTVYLSFLRNGKMYVAVKTGRDFFFTGEK